jgi:branched-chain amino acid transport system permease protein
MSTADRTLARTDAAVAGAMLRGLAPWLSVALIALLLPLVFSSGGAVTMMSRMGVMIVFALSYNMLLGNTGLLSFGHAVYFGLGAYIAMHALQAMNAGTLGLAVELLPLVGALAGLGFGIVFGAVSTRRAGVVFAMISLGIGQLVFASSLMFTGFFGGEGGLSADRDMAPSLFGVDYGPHANVYYLVIVWALLAAAAMHALRRTPLGWMANAVRDNPERAQFVGYSPQTVRFLQFILAAGFAGLAGGLFAITQEIVTDETVGPILSGIVLLSAYIGGIAYFAGPAVGAILVVYLETTLAAVTDAWMLYFGLLFIAVVMFAPQGLVGVGLDQYRAIHSGQWRGTTLIRLYVLAAALIALGGAVVLLELAFHLRHSWDPSLPLSLLFIRVSATDAASWATATVVTGAGIAALQWHAVPMLHRHAQSMQHARNTGQGAH